MTILHAEIMIQDDVRCNGDIAQRIHIKNMLNMWCNQYETQSN